MNNWIDFKLIKPKNRQKIIVAFDTKVTKGTAEAIFIENYESENFVGKNVCVGHSCGFLTEESNYAKFWQPMPDFITTFSNKLRCENCKFILHENCNNRESPFFNKQIPSNKMCMWHST